jgi:RNA polymerase alpha subunit
MSSRIQLDAPNSIAHLRGIPLRSLRDYLLPEIEPRFLRSLHLTVRTQNCLRRLFLQGAIDGLDDLHNHTVGELLDTRDFGMKSLFDLLEAMEAFAKQLPKGEIPEAVTARQILSISQVERIIAEKTYSPLQISHLHLPEIIRSIKLGNLPLKCRTRGCLEKLAREGLVIDAADLSRIEISYLLRTANFGKHTFIDLISNLRPFMLESRQPRAAAPAELSRALEKMSNSRLCATIRCDDPRFKSNLLPLLTIANSNQSSATLPKDSITDLAIRLRAAEFSGAEAERALLSIQGLRLQIRRSFHLKLERELFELARATFDDRTTRVVSRVYGLDGRGGATLQQAGTEYHLTRERIRQICDRIARLVRLQPFLPKLEACIKLIGSRLPNRADNIEKLLLECRLTQTEFRLEGIRMAAELFNKAIRFDVTEVNGIRIAVRIRKQGVASEIQSLAYSSVSRSGVCAVSDIAQSLHEDRESVVGVLSTIQTVRWLSEDREWFFISDSKRNRLRTLISKIAAITPAIRVAELRRAVSRNYHLSIVPPRAVLAAFCKEHGWRVDGDLITASTRPGSEKVLSDTETTMVAVLKRHGPVLYRPEFQELCAAEGISRNTSSAYLWTNPLFSRVATGVYSLTGAHVEPFDVEDCLRRHQASAVTIADYGWTSKARPWIALQVSPSIVASGVFHVPPSIREFLLGGFLVEMGNGTEMGKVQIAKQHAWGLGTLIRRRQIEPGDFVLLEFDLRDRRVRAFLGGAELIESFCKTDLSCKLPVDDTSEP